MAQKMNLSCKAGQIHFHLIVKITGEKLSCDRNIETGSDLLSQGVSPQVSSAWKGLTAVFGMGTGGTPSLSPPERLTN
jgi:hypothetical protein